MTDYMERYTPLRCARFWSRVEIPASDADCWIWKGAKTGRGYGAALIAGKYRPAHLVAWELFNWQLFPDGTAGMHGCDNPACVNRTHILPGTQKENMEDAAAKGRAGRKPKPQGFDL